MDTETIESEQSFTKDDLQKAFSAGYDRRQYKHDENYGGAEYWDEEPKPFKYWIKEYLANDSEKASASEVRVDTIVRLPELRNKLTPISNLIAMIEDCKVIIDSNGKNDEEALGIFFDEMEKAKTAVDELAA